MIREERKNVSGEFRGKFGETQTVHFNGRPWTSANRLAHHAMSDCPQSFAEEPAKLCVSIRLESVRVCGSCLALQIDAIEPVDSSGEHVPYRSRGVCKVGRLLRFGAVRIVEGCNEATEHRFRDLQVAPLGVYRALYALGHRR